MDVSEAFQALKIAVSEASGLSKAALHVVVGLALFFGAAAVLRRPLRSAVPLAVVFVAAVAGEALDVPYYLSEFGYVTWGAALRDIAATVAAPVVLWAVARWRARPSAGERTLGR